MNIIKLRPVFIFFIVAIHSGCTSNIIIRSDPSDATVYARLPGTQDTKSIGKTPLTMNIKTLEKELRISPATGDFVEFIFEKDGYQTETLLVPPTRMVTAETTLGVKLKSGPSQGQIVDSLLQYIDNAQKFTQNKEFERALIEIDRALQINSSFVRAITLKGSIYFLTAKYDQALVWFEKALLVDPKNQDSLKMISHIRENKLVQTQ
jgi:tetratricopeptide (TPR) repeat protein